MSFTYRPPVQLLCIFESLKSWPVEAKRKTRLCSRWQSSVHGHKFRHGESGTSKLHSVPTLNCNGIPGCLYHQVTSFNVVTINIISPSIYICQKGWHTLVVRYCNRFVHYKCDVNVPRIMCKMVPGSPPPYVSSSSCGGRAWERGCPCVVWEQG